MAYLDTPPLGRRIASLGTAGAIELALAAALIAGLSTTFVDQEEAPQIEARNIPDELPPPPDDTVPPPRPDTTVIDPPVPQLPLDLPDLPEFPPIDQPVDTGGPTALPSPVPPRDVPTPRFEGASAKPANTPSRWVTTEDYPARDLREGNQGTTRFKVIVGSNGRVQACEITQSSGFASLDNAACSHVTRRARFEPATDGTGAKVVGSYASSVVWRIPR